MTNDTHKMIWLWNLNSYTMLEQSETYYSGKTMSYPPQQAVCKLTIDGLAKYFMTKFEVWKLVI